MKFRFNANNLTIANSVAQYYKQKIVTAITSSPM